jgi:hypothetical protein
MLQTALGPVSWERMEQGIEKVRQRLLRASSSLRAAGIPYAVVGGNAVAAWVSRVDEAAVRHTRDVNILMRRSDLPAARAALESAGFTHRQVAMLGQGGTMDIFLDDPDAKVRDAIHLLWAQEKIREDHFSPTPDVDEAEDTGEFRLISLAALVTMKLNSFRDKDRMHLRDLIDVGLVDESWTEKLPSELAGRLQEILDNPE